MMTWQVNDNVSLTAESEYDMALGLTWRYVMMTRGWRPKERSSMALGVHEKVVGLTHARVRHM